MERKQRPVMLSEEEYKSCLVLCGPRGFSSWARRALLDAASSHRPERGVSLGGPCYIKDCADQGWCKLKLGSPFYYCRTHIEPMKDQFGMEFDDLRPEGEEVAKTLLLQVKAALTTLTASNRPQEVYNITQQSVDALMQMKQRQLLMEVTVDAAVRSKAVEPESEERRPLAKGFLDSIEGTGGAE